ncbi:integrase family protein [Xylophilus ampelinus]|nr:integrase family protein [Xylophilus ampelinus]
MASATGKTWIYRYKAVETGRMKQTALGPWPAMPIQAAAVRWQALRDQRAAGVDPNEAKRAARKAVHSPATALPTVRRVVEDYIKGELSANRNPAGLLAARRSLERLLDEEPDLAKSPAAALARADAHAALDSRKATPTAAAKLRSLLGAAWSEAIDAATLPEDTRNWWREVLKGKLKSKGKIIGGEHQGRQRRVLQQAEVATLLAWLPNMHSLGRDTTEMYLWTCTRGSEILAMRAAHVTKEADGWWWTVPKALTKNARADDATDLRVPLIGRALDIVRRRLDTIGDSGWLFEDARGEQYTQHDFSTYIYGLQPYSSKATQRTGDGLVLPVTHWTPHQLRRTARTLLASIGCSDEIAEAIIGHLPPEIVATYNAYTYDKERRAWLEKLSQKLEALAACQPT